MIVSVAGEPTPTVSELTSVLAGLEPGRRVAVLVERQDGAHRTLHVRLPGS